MDDFEILGKLGNFIYYCRFGGFRDRAESQKKRRWDNLRLEAN